MRSSKVRWFLGGLVGLYFPAALMAADKPPPAAKLSAAQVVDKHVAARGGRIHVVVPGQAPGRLPAEVIKIVDVKCPDSGEGDTFRIENLEILQSHDEVKFVISGRGDYEFARDFAARHDLARHVHAVLFSPAFSKDASRVRDASNCLLDPRELAEWMLEDNVPARLGLQIHKLIWDPALKGV